MKKHCEKCGEYMTAQRTTRRFCSGRCQKAHGRPDPPKPTARDCAWCSKKFKTISPKALYCSDSHRVMAYRKRKEQS